MIPSTRTPSFVVFKQGAIAMAIAVLVAVGLRAIVGQPTLAETVGDQIVVLIPGNLFEFGIQAFGPLAKRLLFVALGIVQIAVGGGLAFAVVRPRLTGPRSVAAASTFLLGALAAFLALGLVVLVAGGFTAITDSMANLVATALSYGIALAVAYRLTAGPVVHQGEGHARTVWYPTSATVTRRGALTATAGVAVAATGLAIARSTSTPATSIGPQPTSAPTAASAAPLGPNSAPATAVATVAAPTSRPAAAITASAPKPFVTLKLPPGAVPDVTPIDQFYKVSKNFFSDPQVDGQKWRLSIDGLVGRSSTLTMSDLTGLPSIEKPHTLTCISNEVGGNLIGNGLWKGVRLADLLKELGVRDGVRKVVFYAADGYTDSIPLERAMDPGTLLAYQMNGQTLPTEHGYPLRVLVPNIYGMKNAKWLTKIELVKDDFKGYWQRGGWSDPAIIKTMSRIDVVRGSTVGQPITIAGVAFAGERGIARVELSADGGKTWLPAQVKTPDAPDVWSLWVAQWTPAARGTVSLLVRAVDGSGQVQTATSTPPFPDGSSGYHSVDVQIS